MNLHRTTNKPDWSNVPPSEQNAYQRLAVATYSVITPSNIISVVGLVVVSYGLVALSSHHYTQGIGAIIIGRLADLLDGWIAELTGTKSPLGEALDVIVDKICTFLVVIVCFSLHLTSWWILSILVLPHIFITIMTLFAYRQHRVIHPSRIGKNSMAAAWLCIVGLLMVRAANANRSVWMAILNGMVILTAIGALYATVDYARKLYAK